MAQADEGSTPARDPSLLGWSRADLIWLLAIVATAAALLLIGLGQDTMRVYDEGLYGKLARNALTHDQYLHAVDRDGSLYHDFTKPPLTIALTAASFHFVGISLLALRLPFALAMVALVGVCFAWGRRIGGRPLAVAWAAALLLCAAALRWGRVACIEPMLMLWISTALWAYHEALVRRGRAALGWALAAGLALALAFATKQLVVALAVAPIVALELWRRDGRFALARLGVALAVPALAAITWLGLMLQRHGQAVIDVLLHTGVLRRVRGFESGHSARTLNELAGIVGDACQPFPWALGVAGLVLLVLLRPPARRHADGALLLPLLLLTAVLVYDNASQSLLPWYAFDLVVPLCAGVGLLVAGLFAAPTQPHASLHAGAGALVLGLAAITALAPVISQLDAAVLAGLAVVLVMRAAPDSPWRTRGRNALLGLAVLSLAAGTLRSPELRPSLGGHERLMPIFAARGIAEVQVDTDTRLAGEHAWGTYYGPRAEAVPREPWRSRTPVPQAYVTATIWPRELVPENGSELLRGPGVLALVGDLEHPAWGRSTMSTLLDRGPITFEAEDLQSERKDTVRIDPEASAGAARAVVPWGSLRENAFLLTHGPGVRLPVGTYEVEVWLRSDCRGQLEQPAAVIHFAAGSQTLLRHEVPCRAEPSVTYEPVRLEMPMPRTGRLELRVQYVTGELWHDRTVVRRSE